MASLDYRSLAGDLLNHVGGEGNVASVTHCATRLRFKLKDESKADQKTIEKLPGVITVVRAGGQYQVVIGNDVPHVHAELTKITGAGDADEHHAETGNLLNRFIQMISSIFLPILWPLAGAGLFKAFLSLATNFHLLDPASTTYTILNSAADGLFYLLPLFLAVTAAKRFRTNQFTSMAVAAALVYPAIVALGTATGPITFFGLPVVMMNYTSSVIPIIVGVWLQGYLERFLMKVLPSSVRNFGTPLLVLVVMVPLVFLTVGPLTTYAALGISAGVNALFAFAPWIGGAIMGGLWQVFVLFGLHWGFVPIMINDLATQGHSLLTGPLLPAVLAQAGATTAVLLRSRSAKRREVAGPSALSGFLAGVTEPGIYGVNLPLKTPFYFGIAGGAVGGAIAAIGGSAANAFVFPSLLAIPAYMNVGNFTLQLIGTGVAVGIAFALTWVFGPREHADEDVATEDVVAVPDPEEAVPPAATAAHHGGRTVVRTPMIGRLIPLSEVPDPVFSSGSMGSGVGIVPADGTVYAPVSGKVVVAMASGHAYGIRSDEGVEVLVHVGLDTVNMKGAGFTRRVAKGDRVEAGQVLAEVDLDAVRTAGYSTTSVLLITNTKAQSAVDTADTGSVEAGDTALLVTR